MYEKELQKVSFSQAEKLNEIWKGVVNFEDQYQISNLGRIKRKDTDKILSYNQNSKGYVCVNLWKNGIGKNMKLHRLVAEAFIDNKCSKSQVNHINGIKHDNRIENLEWVNSSENIKHAFLNGLNKPNKPNLGKFLGKHPCSKKIVELDKNGTIVNEFSSIKEATLKYNLADGEVCRCCKRKLSQVKGKIFNYK